MAYVYLQFGVPSYIVSLRHECVHGILPSLESLKCATDFKQCVVVMETCNCHGNDIIGIHLCVLPLESLRSEEVNL